VRILWLKTELLHPIDKGGKIRTYQMLRELKRTNHVTYLTLDDGSAVREAPSLAGEYCHKLVCVPHRTRKKFSAGFYVELALNLVSPLPYFLRKYKSEEMRHEILQRAAENQFDILVCDFLHPSINLPTSLPFPTVLFQHNVEAMIWKRHYQVQANPLKKIYLYGQWLKARAYERAACRRFDRVIAVSREDSVTMERDYGVPVVEEVPTGVDTEFFCPSNGGRRRPHNLVFTGSMDWLPNEDAIQYFTREILPLIKGSVPDVTLTVVGRNPYPSLIELSKCDPSIVVTGRVDDVRPYMQTASVYVVPIRIGGGTRLKIYEAMAMGLPIVSTTIGAEGLPVRDGLDLVLGDTPKDFAARVVELLSDEVRARAISVRAAELVRQHFGWGRAAARFADICENVISRRAILHKLREPGEIRLAPGSLKE
jgi:glycosyltransferase involved in cell wall biosynthesis